MSQKAVGSLYTAKEIKAWLSGPLPRLFLKALTDFDRQMAPALEYARAHNSETNFRISKQQIDELQMTFNTLQPSISAAFLLSSPSLLLNISLGSFIMALGIYLGFVWTRNLDTQAGVHDSRDVFIFFAISVFTFVVVYYLPATFKTIESDRHKVVENFLHRLEQFQTENSTDESGADKHILGLRAASENQLTKLDEILSTLQAQKRSIDQFLERLGPET